MKNLIKKFNGIYVFKVVVNSWGATQSFIYHDSYFEAFSQCMYFIETLRIKASVQRCSLWFSLKYRLNKYFKLDF